ncbi:spinster family MFS transporter [Niveispirillum fermenti]|uniref:spinster family MFS transporter n=1 Tax=Niveispirillum fermenti TaxID=1233113 RepID=UPI003A891664
MLKRLATSPSYAMVLLFLAYTMNFVDRQLITVLLNDIRADLGLSDAQLGIISGAGFALFYVIAGVPLGYLADRINRSRLLAASIIVWSGMTALCGAASSFTQMLLARIGVAVGEAGGTPASLSLIGDYYPPAVRSSKLGIYFSGAALATMVSYAVGGWVNEMFGWRVTFALFALPGILIGLALLFTIQEPPRGRFDEGKPVADLTLRRGLAVLMRTPLFPTLCLGYVGSNFVLYTVLTWGPSVAMRSYGLGSGDIGLLMGLTSGIVAGAAHILGGLLADRLRRAGGHVPLYYTAATQVACALLVLAFLTAGSFSLFAVFFALAFGAGALYAAPSMAVTQSILPPNLRAMGAAILLLFGTVAGLGMGPLIVGALSDHLHPVHGEQSLRLALLVLVLVGLLTSLVYAYAAWRLRADPQDTAMEPG